MTDRDPITLEDLERLDGEVYRVELYRAELYDELRRVTADADELRARRRAARAEYRRQAARPLVEP